MNIFQILNTINHIIAIIEQSCSTVKLYMNNEVLGIIKY